MRIKTLIRLTACSLALAAAAPAFAQVELGSGLSVSGNATLVTDYRFRGVSQSDRRFALQGGFTLSHESGVYATVWGSSIDDYVANGSDQEVDFVVGYSHSWGGTTVDLGLLYYYYPGAGGVDTDFFEPYLSVSHEFGPVTGKVTANYAWSQSALSIGAGNEDNFYLAGDLSADIGDSGFSVSGHLGHSFGPSYLTIGDNYTDWNLGVSYSTGPLSIGVMYVDTDATSISGNGRNISGSGVVGTLGVAF